MYPVMLQLKDRRCLVVGGGGVAARKVDGLLVEGARVVVVAPDPVSGIERLAASGSISLERRPYQPGEARGYALVFAATDDRETNRQVYVDASSARIWANVADDPELCSFHLPARIQRGALQIAIASAGEAPFVVRRLRQLLERRLGPEREWIEAAARFRQAVRGKELPRSEQERLYDLFFAGTVEGAGLVARVPTADVEASWLDDQDAEEAETAAETAEDPRPTGLAPRDDFGLVSLVGAGPGDPGLLPLKGLRRLRQADVVAYDRLAATALPCDLPATVELHCVGKTAGHHPVPQDQITALLVRLARQGKRVVRLKGGDPYVFGRGGEEAETLAAAGVPFEVIPGVSAGIAAPAYAGIPITHRGEVVRVTIVTAHECIKRDGPQVRWDLIAADPHATLIGYMGVTSLPDVVERLLGAGMDPATPAAMIERGTTSGQRAVRDTVAGLPSAVVREGIKPPALFVIGPTVRHAETLDWRGALPLRGERIGIFAPAGKLGEALEASGAEIVAAPRPVTPAARIVIDALPLTGWVLRDAEEAQALDDERDGPSWNERTVVWSFGEEASRRARDLGWQLVEDLAFETPPDELVAAVRARGGQ